MSTSMVVTPTRPTGPDVLAIVARADLAESTRRKYRSALSLCWPRNTSVGKLCATISFYGEITADLERMYYSAMTTGDARDHGYPYNNIAKVQSP